MGLRRNEERQEQEVKCVPMNEPLAGPLRKAELGDYSDMNEQDGVVWHQLEAEKVEITTQQAEE